VPSVFPFWLCVQSDCSKKSRVTAGGGDGGSSGSGALTESMNASIGERRKRRKPKHEVLQDADDGVFYVAGQSCIDNYILRIRQRTLCIYVC